MVYRSINNYYIIVMHAIFGNVYANIILQCCIYKNIAIFECSIRVFDGSIREYRSFDTVDVGNHSEVLEKLRPLLFRGVLAFLAFLSAHMCNKAQHA